MILRRYDKMYTWITVKEEFQKRMTQQGEWLCDDGINISDWISQQ